MFDGKTMAYLAGILVAALWMFLVYVVGIFDPSKEQLEKMKSRVRK